MLKILRRLFRPRRWFRTASLYILHADGPGEKLRVMKYYLIEIARFLGLRRDGDEEWHLRLDGLAIHFNPTMSELTPYKGIFVNRAYQRLPDFAPRGPAVVFDLGANIGLYALQAARGLEDGIVYSFEPNPSAYARLLRNIEANGVKNVRTFPCAVGAAPGRVRMRMGSRTNVGEVVRDGDEGGRQIEVEMVTLDSMVEKLGVTRIDLIKMDVEGHEDRVLMGGERAAAMADRIVMEYHGLELLSKVRDFLEARGYQQVLEYRGHAYFVNRLRVK
jgi:FkbM family methyltransferase